MRLTIGQFSLKRIIKLTNSFAEGEFISHLPVDDPMQRQPDITKARTLLRFGRPKSKIEPKAYQKITNLRTILKSCRKSNSIKKTQYIRRFI